VIPSGLSSTVTRWLGFDGPVAVTTTVALFEAVPFVASRTVAWTVQLPDRAGPQVRNGVSFVTQPGGSPEYE